MGVPLSQMRSHSYEVPRPSPLSKGRSTTYHRGQSEIFTKIPNKEEKEWRGLHPLKPPNRPKMSSRGNSFAQSITSASLYENFAGERFDRPANRKNHSERHPIDEEFNLGSSTSLSSELKPTVSTSTYPLPRPYINGTTAGVPNGNAPTFDSDDNVEDDRPKSSVGKAMFMFLKAFIGSGVLFLPKAFQNGGLALSIVLMVLIASICLFAFLQLVKTQKQIGGSYGTIGGYLYGKTVRYIVLFFIVISQIGFVCSYFIFVSGSLVKAVDVLSSCRSPIQEKYYIWMPLVVLIPLSLIRHMARLSFTAIAADIFIMFGLICVVYFSGSQLATNGVGPNVQAVNPANFALMIGTATFSFEGIGLIIPIVESMKRPSQFPFVVTVGMIIVCSVYILIATLSYLAYGDTIQAAVIYNFPRDNKLTVAVQIVYAAAIILTAPMMLFPALKILENGIFQKFAPDNLDKFVSLVGSVACVPLCFIFPGMFHLKIATNRKDKIFDTLLIIWGVGIMVFTLYVTINSFVHPGPAGEALEPYCPA
ncbi:transmembrane amino acid transporter protein-domain-containing protein [Phycomyces blakesleeanus]|uniref:Transmembrane amino acid transporter protein-domain-containing protein n=1 Tax=Phycomyces blakesleeanus TaxID=4837 RepID=A0ABR3BCL3_PHYBL